MSFSFSSLESGKTGGGIFGGGIELFPESSTLHKILSFSQIFCQWLQLPDLKVCGALPATQGKKRRIA